MKALDDWLDRTKTKQADLAKRVGVSQPTIANLANGVHSASADVLKRIARETGLSLDELLADDTSSRSGHVA